MSISLLYGLRSERITCNNNCVILFRPRSHSAGKKKNENAALLLRFGLPPTLIRHKNGAFRKRSSNWRNLKTPALCFGVDENHFDNGAFENDDTTIIV